MRPYCSGSRSVGWVAGRRPARVRISGRMLLPREMCRTTKIDARISRGSSATNRLTASTPPADAPTTTTSCLAITAHLLRAKLCKTRDIARRAGVMRPDAFVLGRETERHGDGEGLQRAH